MSITGFLKMPDIDGESQAQDHQNEIDIFGVQWSVSQTDGAVSGQGRRKARADVDELRLAKIYDASSPYLSLACMTGKSFDEVTISLRKDNGEAHLDYLVITLSNVAVREYVMESDEMEGAVVENIAFGFEQIKLRYVTQADDHSAGDEHEIQFDIAAGV